MTDLESAIRVIDLLADRMSPAEVGAYSAAISFVTRHFRGSRNSPAVAAYNPIETAPPWRLLKLHLNGPEPKHIFGTLNESRQIVMIFKDPGADDKKCTTDNLAGWSLP